MIKLFKFDFACAVIGSLIYIFLFNFLIETLQIPKNIVTLQLCANLLYATYGFFLLRSKTQREGFYRILARGNHIYALICIIFGGILLYDRVVFGGLLLMTEAILVSHLGRFELQMIDRHFRPPEDFEESADVLSSDKMEIF